MARYIGYIIVSIMVFMIDIHAIYAQATAPTSTLDMHNAALPISIEADKLLVLQKDTLAVFSGNVEVKQGNVQVKADEMKVHYRPKNVQKEGANAVERIDIKGNVFFSTPNETAQGDKGYFNVDDRIIVLSGNVMLTQSETIVQGDDLYYNMMTGHSEIRRRTDDTKKTNGRVRMITNPSAISTQQEQE